MSRPRPRHGHKYTKYKIYFTKATFESRFMKNLSNTEAELKQSVAYKTNLWVTPSRNSHRRCSLQKCVLKNFANFTRKNLCRSFSFSKKLQL